MEDRDSGSSTMPLPPTQRNPMLQEERSQSSHLEERQTSSQKIQGSGFDFDFAFLSQTFADCMLRLYIETPSGYQGDELPPSIQHESPSDEDLETKADPSSSLMSDEVRVVGDESSSTPAPHSDFLAASSPAEIPGTSSVNGETNWLYVPEELEREEAVAPEIEEIPVTAVVLAAKSSFFLKMFTSGMRESLNKGSVTIHLTAQEKPVMMELLSFIYKGTVCSEFSDSFENTLQLLLLADRFGVEDCLQACVDRLNEDIPRIKWQEALQILTIPASVLESAALRPILVVSRACIVDHFGPQISSPLTEEFLSLSMPGLQTLLKADDLAVDNEERVFTATIEWVKHNFKDPVVRRDVVSTLVEDIRFPWMAASFIKSAVMAAPEMRTESSRNLVVDALLFMAAKDDDLGFLPTRQLALRDPRSWCRPRHSFTPPAKSVYFDIPLSYCKAWSPNVSFQATSGPFCAAGKWFTLNAKLENQKEGGPRFGLFLRLDKQATFPAGEEPSDVNCHYRFCVKTITSGSGYQMAKSKSRCTFGEPYHGWGSRDLFKKSWQEIMANYEIYFPEGAMQLRADLWIDE